MTKIADQYYTLAEGQPAPRNDTSDQLRTGGGGGHVLFTSTQLFETLAHFSRERIPERSVHAKAAGALGYYEVTDDISDLTDADFLTGVGKKTELLTRISTVGPEKGSADTVRDFRGWAFKFKTAEGNQDWVFNNQPVFFVRDPMKFPSLNRSHKKHPTTNASNADMFWDFHVSSPESIHALMFLFSDRGLPSSLRNINGYSGHTYSLTKANGSYHYIRIHVISNQGIHYHTNIEGATAAGTNPDEHLLDLRDAIDSGNYPSWNVKIQVLHPDAVSQAPVDVFDMTKIWPHGLYPLRTIGRIVLNRNPQNFFSEIEQAAFSPSNMVPGFGASPDPMLQARLFAYPDAARYRLGVNYQFLPTNAAKSPVYTPTQRDGSMNFTNNHGGDPNYLGSTIQPTRFYHTPEKTVGKPGKVAHVNSTLADGSNTLDQPRPSEPVSFASEVSPKDFEQATALWHVMGKQEGAQERFVGNVAAHVSEVTLDWLRDGVYAMFAKVDIELSEKIKRTTETKIEGNHAHPHKTAWH